MRTDAPRPFSLSKFGALTGLALTELLRQPVSFMITATSVILTILLPMATAIQLGQQERLSRDSALAFEFVFGMMLAGYAAASTLHNECRSGTVLTVLSKPVGRAVFFLAKFTAVAALLACFAAESALAALLGARLTPVFFEIDTLGAGVALAIPIVAFAGAATVNFFRRRPFVSTAHAFLALSLLAAVLVMASVDRDGHRIAFGSLMDWRLVPACGFESLALIMLAAVALSLATRLGAAPTIAVLIVVLFAGLLSDHLGRLLPASNALRWTLRSVVPNLQAFWPADELTAGGGITLAAAGTGALYAACYAMGVLCLGLVSFRGRQF